MRARKYTPGPSVYEYVPFGTENVIVSLGLDAPAVTLDGQSCGRGLCVPVWFPIVTDHGSPQNSGLEHAPSCWKTTQWRIDELSQDAVDVMVTVSLAGPMAR